MDTFHIYSRERNLTYITNGSNFVISHLDPGIKYHLWARVVFKNVESNITEIIMVCTGEV